MCPCKTKQRKSPGQDDVTAVRAHMAFCSFVILSYSSSVETCLICGISVSMLIHPWRCSIDFGSTYPNL
jgi:hypothetical protein